MDTVQNERALELLTPKRALWPALPDRVVQKFIWAARLAFVVALAAVLYGSLAAIDPLAAPNEWIPWDKARHYLAYLVLSALALIAFANVPAAIIGMGLIFVGVGIESLQPLFDRSFSVFDILANALGILTVLGTLLLVALRQRLQND